MVDSYKQHTERALLFDTCSEEYIASDGQNQEDCDVIMARLFSEREAYCFSRELRWNYDTQLALYVSYSAHYQLSQNMPLDERIPAACYLIDMASHVVADAPTQSWRAADKVISALMNEKWGETYHAAFGGLQQNIDFGEDGYDGVLSNLYSLVTTRRRFFIWNRLKNIVPDPIRVPQDDIADHLEQRRLYGISTYDMDSPRAFLAWLAINGAFYFGRRNASSHPMRYVGENPSDYYRKDLIEFIIGMYIFGFKDGQMTDEDVLLSQRALDNYRLYTQSFWD